MSLYSKKYRELDKKLIYWNEIKRNCTIMINSLPSTKFFSIIKYIGKRKIALEEIEKINAEQRELVNILFKEQRNIHERIKDFSITLYDALLKRIEDLGIDYSEDRVYSTEEVFKIISPFSLSFSVNEVVSETDTWYTSSFSIRTNNKFFDVIFDNSFEVYGTLKEVSSMLAGIEFEARGHKELFDK